MSNLEPSNLEVFQYRIYAVKEKKFKVFMLCNIILTAGLYTNLIYNSCYHFLRIVPIREKMFFEERMLSTTFAF